jgi:hypothetical protein
MLDKVGLVLPVRPPSVAAVVAVSDVVDDVVSFVVVVVLVFSLESRLDKI